MRPSGDGFSELLEETIQAADRVREATVRGAEPVQTSALNGWVQIELGVNGRLSSLELDPEVRRMPVERLAAAVLQAVNAALDEQQAQTGLPLPAVDLTEVMAQLREVQNAAVPQLRSFIDAMTTAHRQATERFDR